MKTKLHATSLLLAVALGLLAPSSTFAAPRQEPPTALEARAKISETRARELALARVPHGTIKEGELEEEDGRLVWSFDVSVPGTRDITEVQVDAVTGAIVSVKTETPQDESDEAKQEKKEKSAQDPLTKREGKERK